MLRHLSAFLFAVLSATSLQAGEADVIAAKALHQGAGVWQFEVTVAHADEGWNHYADQFDVLDKAGKVLGVRTLHHPHEHEQPFTRSLGGVRVPETVEFVVIRARDSVHGHGGKELEVRLPR